MLYLSYPLFASPKWRTYHLIGWDSHTLACAKFRNLKVILFLSFPISSIASSWYYVGEYSVESLLEMIAWHLDATYAEYNTWRVFSLCFFILSNNEEDRISACASNNKDEHRQHRSSFLSTTPKMFTEGKLGKAWRLRCRWWLTRHFSRSRLESEIKAGTSNAFLFMLIHLLSWLIMHWRIWFG